MADNFTLTGDKELDTLNRALMLIPGPIAGLVIADGMVGAARVVRDQARQTAPVKTGEYKASIRARKAKVKRRRGTQNTVIGAFVRAGPLAYLLEFGHGGPRPAPPYPHLIPALVGTSAQQLRAFATGGRRSFERLARNLASGKNLARVARLVR